MFNIMTPVHNTALYTWNFAKWLDLKCSQHKTKQIKMLTRWGEVLTNLTMLIILQYMRISSCQVVHLNDTTLLITPQQNWIFKVLILVGNKNRELKLLFQRKLDT
jgi:hypothetical protein